jgi:Phasin protein
MRELARCTNPSEAFALQAKFANQMAADYFAEGQKIVEIMGEMAKEISSSPKADKAHH